MEQSKVPPYGTTNGEPQRSKKTKTGNLKQKKKATRARAAAAAAAAANQNATPPLETAQDGDETTLVNDTASKMSQNIEKESGPAFNGVEATIIANSIAPTASATRLEDCLQGPEVEVYHNTATGRELIDKIHLRLLTRLSIAAETAFSSPPTLVGAAPDQYIISTTSNTSFALKVILKWMKDCAAAGGILCLSAFPRKKRGITILDLYRVYETARNMKVRTSVVTILNRIKQRMSHDVLDAYTLSLLWKNRKNHADLTSHAIQQMCFHWVAGHHGDWEAVELYLEKVPNLKAQVVQEGQLRQLEFFMKKEDERMEMVTENEDSISKVDEWKVELEHEKAEHDTTSWDWTEGNPLKEIGLSPPASVGKGVPSREVKVGETYFGPPK
ncbi:uncharacterized protein BDZ99DRAFT_480448 [Mytilinidion resinicola]|uniref:Uncharacterized protein n=1 Tax=Mytilinidion resinicola TaxID=574789 RepID=A0A6A6Y8J6_9PEZI|nr:uncharacterized protein BDZ99DRAFT_480448 [Mytilinidion resinicola]KAF2805020.1 hypothetical protein BDZ99DRAFT_480448 [Mytilinidion resinicola]